MRDRTPPGIKIVPGFLAVAGFALLALGAGTAQFVS